MKRKNFACFALIFTLIILSPGAPRGQERRHMPHWAYSLPGTLKDTPAQTLSRLQVLSRTGHKLDGRGGLRSSSTLSPHLRKLVKKYKISLAPLVSLTSVAAGKRLLRNPAATRRALKNLEALSNKGKYQGLHLDFEYLPPGYAADYARFLKALKSRMGGRRLSAAIFPSVDFPAKWAGFHNLKLLGPHLDEIVLMCYDRHRPGSAPGPVTGLNWAERNVRAALKHLPSQKIWLGVPAYGYAWPLKGRGRGIVVSARKALRMKTIGLRRHESGTVYFRFRRRGRGRIYQAYLSDAHTRRDLGKIARKYGLKGTALWRLGFQEPEE